MRIRANNAELSVHAIAGAHVVLLAFDATPSAAKGLLGFGIQRTDRTQSESSWLQGLLTFEATMPDPAPGQLFSTQHHPVQKMLWLDDAVVGAHHYTYRVVPMYGCPTELRPGPAVEVEVATEDEDDGTHAVYFNRGVAGSQAYARKFGDVPPTTPAQFQWLSRGLAEAMEAFIGQARGSRYSLRAAVYEFSYLPLLQAFGAAAASGADVKIVYDARPGKDKPVQESDRAIEAAGIRKLMIARTTNPSYISHNKFIVLLDNGRPIQVWTGSTNFTEGGIFGQTNVGHLVRDPAMAQAYLAYWEMLATDPEAEDFRAWNHEHSPVLGGFPPAGRMLPIFSPRKTLAALERYRDLMDQASHGVYFTAAFGVNSLLTEVFEEDKPYLRYVILDNPGSTSSVRHHTELIMGNPDNRVAIGATAATGQLHRWLHERLTGLNEHVKYIHTKFLLIDPLTDDPILIGGSANFSNNSTKNNDENMLVVRGNTRVADMYLGEFMRVFFHFYARDVAHQRQSAIDADKRVNDFLAPDDSWTKPYYEKGSVEEKQRLAFR